MKYLFSIIMLFCSLGISARDYLPILKEGRVWNCIASPNMIKHYPRSYQIYVAEEVYENGHTCKVLRWKDDNHLYATAYEENGKVYAVNFDGGLYPELLMLDFNLEKGYVLYEGFDYYISEVDYIEFNGIRRKRLTISRLRNPSNPVLYWIEGIGPTYDTWASDVPRAGTVYYLESCYDDGVCVFKNDEPPFWSDWTEGVETVKSNIKSAGNKTFDTSGRIINDKDYKGIVIKDGKKFCK